MLFLYLFSDEQSVRGEVKLKGTKASAEKAFQGSEAEARELLGGKKENGVFSKWEVIN